MGLTVNHVFTSPIADGTNTQIVRPSDWNSAHNVVFSQDVVIGGNTQGVSTIAGDKLYLHGGNNVTLSGNGSTVTIIGPTPGAGGGAGTQFSGTNISGTIDTNGISLSVNPGGGAGDGYNVIGVNGAGTNSATTIQFNNGNNVTFGLNAGTITASASFPAQTVDTNKAGTGFTTVATAGAVMAGTHDTNGLNLAVPAFLTTAQPVGAYLTTAALSNHSHNLATTTTNGSQIVVATTNSAGATLAVPAFLTTAQPVGAYLTTARASNDAIGLNTAITQNGVSMTANSSGLSLNFPAFLTTAAQSGHSHNLATTTTNGSQIVIATTNSAGATMAVPPFITTYVGQTTQTQPAGNIAGVGTTFGGTNISGSMTLNSNGLALSLSGQGGGVVNQTGPNIAAGTQTATSGTVVFANSNNITFGMSGDTQVTASFNPINIGMSTNGNTAGTTGTFDGAGLQYILAGGNNVTLSQSANGSSVTLSIHAGGGGGGFTRQYFDNLGPMNTISGAMGTKQVQQNQVQLFPLKPYQDLFNGSMTLNTMLLDLSVSGSTATLSAGGISTVLRFGLYTVVTTGASLSIGLVNSFGKTLGLAGASTNNSTFWNGQRWLSVHSSEWSSQPVLSDNVMYVCGAHWSSIGSSAQTFAMIGGFMGSTAARSGFLGEANANATHNGNVNPFMGVYGTTTGALPTGVNFTQVNKQSASANFVPHIIAHTYTNLTRL